MKPIIVIPNYNDNKYLANLVDQIHLLTNTQILIIDDGSTKPVEPIDGVIHLKNRVNRGKGYSLLKSFTHANELGYTHAITLDADSQHHPKYINDMIEIDDDVDIVFGRRQFNFDMPFIRRLSNKLTSKIISILSGFKDIYDSQCGYRRYKLNSILELKLKEHGFQFESEVILQLSTLSSSKIRNLNIETIYGSEESSISNIKDTFKFIRLIIRSLLFKKA